MKMKNKNTFEQKEMKEGASYQSGVALLNMCDVTEIPQSTYHPVSCKIFPDDISVQVYCDI